MQGGFRQRRFLVLHGFTNRRWVGHWQRLLTSTLRDEGEQVVYPQLPDPDSPDVEAWLGVLTTELDLLGDPAEFERVVVPRSGCTRAPGDSRPPSSGSCSSHRQARRRSPRRSPRSPLSPR